MQNQGERKVLEQSVQDDIRLYLSQQGIINIRINVGKVKMRDGRWFDTGAPTGHSDVYGVMPGGRTIFVECKTPKEYKALQSRINRGKLTQHDSDQINFINQMVKQGAIGGFCDSAESVEKLIGDFA